jgi:hypothetical protein
MKYGEGSSLNQFQYDGTVATASNFEGTFNLII